MILICDNEPEHISWLTEYLADKEVIIVGNLESALENLKENVYDLVLINLEMPSATSILRLSKVLSYFTSEVIGYTGMYSTEANVLSSEFRYATVARPFDFKKAVNESLSTRGA